MKQKQNIEIGIVKQSHIGNKLVLRNRQISGLWEKREAQQLEIENMSEDITSPRI